MNGSPAKPDFLAKSAPWILLLVGLVLLGAGLGMLPMIDRDEPRFSRATVEMLEGGDWVVPYFNGEYRFDKPPLTYWLMSVPYRVFGVHEWTARAHAVVAALLLGLVTWAIGRKHLGARAGLVAGFGLLTSVQLLIHGRSAVADLPMVLAVALMQWSMYELLHGAEFRWRWVWLFSLSMAGGFLAKGPIAWAVPLLAGLLHRFVFHRQPLPWSRLKLGLGVPAALALVAAWGIPALLRTHGAFWTVGMQRHVVERGMESFNGRTSLPFIFYPVVALVSLFPWLAFAGAAVPTLRTLRTPLNAFLLSWFLAPYLIFSFYSTQLPHYVLPGFPAFFLLIAQAPALRGEAARAGRWFRIYAGLHFLIACALLAAPFAFKLPGPGNGLPRAVFGIGVAWTSLLVLILLVRTASPLRSLLAVPGVAIGLILACGGLRAVSPAVQLKPLFDQAPADTVWAAWKFREPSLVFYSGARWTILDDAAALQNFLQQPGPHAAVTLEEESKLDAYLRRDAGPRAKKSWADELNALPLDGLSVRNFEGFNTARGTWVKLRILTRGWPQPPGGEAKEQPEQDPHS